MVSPNPIAFSVGSLEIRWYGILIALALLVGIVISYFIAKYRGEKQDEIINFAPFAVIFGVIGARLLHVVVNWSYYSGHLSYIFAFRKGGLAIQGVMLGGILALVVFCKIRKLDFWKWADIMSPALLLGQAIGRWGNYFNQEAFGLPTSLPWGIYIDPINRPPSYSNAEFFHPTFLYESIANLVLFALLLLILRLYNKRPDKFPNGLVFATYLGVYAIYRSIIEYYRIDSSFVLGIKVVYILNGITVIAVLIIINYLVKKFREKKIREEIEKLEE
ncbi:MAG: prolipoprotein diacylglyceryl transferase [Actinobacteria bacterium]|nr:prolipoprotein diacylglyceryl transferase [Actinomycetota bacterium]MCG2788847.1 prolipoprotein diacylglyceryl transferase [Actinomycetes bacterium]